MPTAESLAAVVTDKRQIEMRSFPVPQVSPADAILKVELCGICGSDYHYYTEGEHWPYQLPPQILGHEVVGRIDKIGQSARREQLSQLLTHELPLFKADLALRLIGQEIPGEEAIHVALNPWSE